MKHTGRIFVNVVITGSGPVTVAIDQGDIGGKKPKCTINIEHTIEFVFQLISRCLIKQFAQRDQITPRLLIILGLDLKTFTIRLDVLTEIPQASITPWAAMHFPASPFFCAVICFDEIAIELLNIAIHPPAFAINHHVHEVRAWRRNF